MIGTTLGRYRILEPLGEGGMGRVFLAEDPALARRVAIKVLPPEFSTDVERRQRLLHEARAASALNHPNILTIHDLGDEGGTIYVAMELIEGETLRQWAGAKARTPDELLALVRQVTRALAVAHAAGLVHRDLKPENLMVRRDGLVKILDFGLARSVSPERDGATIAQTMPGTILGTAPYMSPEQVLGQPAGPASDVFSLGTITYELLTGQHPFAAATPVDTMHRILHETPPAPSRLNAALPGALDFVLAKALAKDPARRYANARELDIDLETCQAGLVPAPTTAATAAAGRGPRAIAVLPFKNIGGSPDLNYLGVGLADAVITRLSSSPDLIVRGTMSIARYENQAVDPRTVARELDVTAVLDASFQRVGERFRATARLVESAGGQALWAGKVDLDFSDIFEVQDQVAQGIATALTARLAEGNHAGFTPSPEAFELYMRGQEATRVGTRAGLQRAIELAQRAVAIEPGYADGWALLGAALHSMTDGGFDHDTSWFARAEEACRRALAIDPDHAQARFLMGSLHLVRGRKREAYRAFVDAYRRMPNDSTLFHYIAYLLRLCDMLPEAFAAEARSIELDPTSPWQNWMMFRLYMESGDLARAVESFERSRARFPDHPRVPFIESVVARAQGRYAEALERIDNLGMKSELVSSLHFVRALSLIGLGRSAETGPHVAKVDEAGEIDMDFALSAAQLHGMLGNRDRAFHFLERAVQLGNDSLYAYELPGNFDAIKDDPRWEPFLAGVRARVAEYKREFRWPLD